MLPLLQGVRVLDFSRFLSGDLATLKLADLGADVIKVEHPNRADCLRNLPPLLSGVGLFYAVANRNKRSVALNYTSEEGRQILATLIRSADVMVDVSRPGSRLGEGLDYDSVSSVNPALVYCSISGYGRIAPYRDFPAHGFNIDGAAGLLQVRDTAPGNSQDPSGAGGTLPQLPEIDGVSLAGVYAGMNAVALGGMDAALAIIAALLHRTCTGVGQNLEISCWDSAVAGLGTAIDVGHLINLGQRYPKETPLGPKYNVYTAADGRVLVVAPIEPWFWERFCRAVGKKEWIDQWSRCGGDSDAAHGGSALRVEIARVLLKRPRDEWLDIFHSAGVPVSPLDTLEEVVTGRQMADREMLVKAFHPDYGDIWLVSQPIKTSAATFTPRFPPPLRGDHTSEVLADLGYETHRIAELVDNGIIACNS